MTSLTKFKGYVAFKHMYFAHICASLYLQVGLIFEAATMVCIVLAFFLVGIYAWRMLRRAQTILNGMMERVRVAPVFRLDTK